MLIRSAAFVVCVIALTAPASAASLNEVWRATGFDLPESVTFDPATQAFYVSNMGTNPTDKDGNGFIARLDAAGNVTDLKWVTGLNAPKGTIVADGKLYVTDIDQVVEIDIASGAIANRYPAEGAQFLNDIAIAPDGRIFVADTFINAVYVLEDGALSIWLQDPSVVGPNGLVVMDGNLLVAELGDASGGFENLVPGAVKSVDLETKAVSDFGPPSPVGGLDGIEIFGADSVTVTDNPGGRLLAITPGEPVTELGVLSPGTADHEWVPAQNVFVIPNLQISEVAGYELVE